MNSPNQSLIDLSNRERINHENRISDVVIRLAGNSQDGIQTIGGFLARLAGRSDQDVMTYMTIPSTISGGESIFQVRMGSGEVLSAGDSADFLVAFYQHSYESHVDSLNEGGVVLYDSDQVKPNLKDKRFLYAGVPFTGMTIEALGGTARDKGKNLFVLGVLSRLFRLNVTKLRNLMAEKFEGKDPSILRNVLVAFDAGHGYNIDNLLHRYYSFTPSIQYDPDATPQVTMDGNQALAYGLIAAGVRFGAGYPITPWTTVMEILRAELTKYDGMFVQCEDELAAVSMAIGFSYSGHLGVTGTSGPGLSLKSEAIGWAVMAEIPLIVIDVMRGGPSTGLPTHVEQSDLKIAVYGSHGDAPRVVIAPRDVEDCFYSAIEAARIARTYSVPVIILSDQSLATRIEAFDLPDLESIMVDPRPDLNPKLEGWRPYALDRLTRHAPPGTRFDDRQFPTLSGLEHDEKGHPSANPQLHMKMTAKRRRKLNRLAAEYPRLEAYGDPDGDFLLVGWGSTWGPIRETLRAARASGMKIGHLHLRHLFPVASGMARVFSRYKQVFVVEMNDAGVYGYGQLAGMLRARTCNPLIKSITKTDGLSFKVSEILEGIERLRMERDSSFSSYPEA